jgi:hypothetical protein
MAKRPNSNFRSGYERNIAGNLRRRKVQFKYESTKLNWTSDHVYTPDFELANGILVEAKGYLRPTDRSKMVKARDQNPQCDIRFLFANAQNPVKKGSKTTYAMWAEKNGFKWASGIEIPQEWIDET